MIPVKITTPSGRYSIISDRGSEVAEKFAPTMPLQAEHNRVAQPYVAINFSSDDEPVSRVALSEWASTHIIDSSLLAGWSVQTT